MSYFTDKECFFLLFIIKTGKPNQLLPTLILVETLDFLTRVSIYTVDEVALSAALSATYWLLTPAKILAPTMLGS